MHAFEGCVGTVPGQIAGIDGTRVTARSTNMVEASFMRNSAYQGKVAACQLDITQHQDSLQGYVASLLLQRWQLCCCAHLTAWWG